MGKTGKKYLVTQVQRFDNAREKWVIKQKQMTKTRKLSTGYFTCIEKNHRRHYEYGN